MLVTGHTGFKGSWLCAWLERLGAEVTGLSLPPATTPSLFALIEGKAKLRHLLGDIRDLSVVEKAFAESRPEVVFHLAAQALVLDSYDDPVGTFGTNVQGTVHVLDCVRRTPGVQAIVTVTSDKCYENRGLDRGYRESDALGGHDPYAASKAAAEVVAAAYGSSFFVAAGIGSATVRAGNVIGGGDWAANRLVPDCIGALARGEPIDVRSPAAIRPWQHVLEPLSGYLRLAALLVEEPEARSGAWNFGPAHEDACTVAELCDHIVATWGSGSWRDVSTTTAPHEAAVLRLSSEKAKSKLGWSPRWGLATAIAETVQWYRAHAIGQEAHQLCQDQISRYEGCE